LEAGKASQGKGFVILKGTTGRADCPEMVR